MKRSVWTVAIVVMFAALLSGIGTAAAQGDQTITVTPNTGLSDGDTVSVTVTGFPAESAAFSSGQCVTPLEDFLQQCDVTNIVAVPLDADGGATFEITLKTGAIGSGMCGEGADQCVVAVGSLTEPESAGGPIFFGADGPAEEAADEPADEPAETELAETGPADLAMTVIIALTVIAAGLMMVQTSRRLLIR